MLLSSCATFLIITCAVIILTLVVVFLLIQQWIQSRKASQLVHLRQPDSEGRNPVVVGFFHPYCNAGGGGERVLWIAIRALQLQYPHVKCVVYTGDTNVTENEIMATMRERFNIKLPRPVEFVFLQHRVWVEAARYPYFTLLGQSFGSLRLGLEALMKCVPDIYIDSMGYAFTIPLFKYLGKCKVACYVHYPTISTDMLDRVQERTATYNNAGFISRSPILSSFKLYYYKLFAYIYGVMGKRCNIVMVNSSWTQGHILSLWKAPDRTYVVYPPCDTTSFLEIPLNNRDKFSVQSIVSIAQFRPEKDHPLQIRSFNQFIKELPDKKRTAYKLVLVGSCRNDDDRERVGNLRKLCQELEISEYVEFCLNIPFAQLKQCMAEATVGLHTMWNEHFGIGVVELMAAGTVVLAHNSGGPKLDIVTPLRGQTTGFLADTEESYTKAIRMIFSLSPSERTAIQSAARESVNRFSEKEFESGFLNATETLFIENPFY